MTRRKLSPFTQAFGNRQITSCVTALRLLQRALDGELDERTLRRVNRHFDACLHCGMEADRYRQIKAAINRHAPPVLSPAVLQELSEFAERLRTGGSETAD